MKNYQKLFSDYRKHVRKIVNANSDRDIKNIDVPTISEFEKLQKKRRTK